MYKNYKVSCTFLLNLKRIHLFHLLAHLNICVGPPQNIDVKSYSNDSLFISWTSLQVPYEITTQYIISYNGSKRDVFGDDASKTRDGTIIDGLKPYSTYAVQIQTCIHIPLLTGFDCSDKSDPIMIRTEIGGNCICFQYTKGIP